MNIPARLKQFFIPHLSGISDEVLADSVKNNRHSSEHSQKQEPLPEAPPLIPSVLEQLEMIEQFETPATPAVPVIGQNDIDEAIRNWNGNIDSKIAVLSI